MSEPAVSVRDLAKAYRLYRRPSDRFREALTGRNRHELYWALDGVTFDLVPGQSLGIIGENGAGKSTLLRIVTGTTTPTRGSVVTRGAVASILELGMGFHPEFSGRENARLNAALLGLSAAEIRRRMPAIAEFSELGAFLDRPVKTYSTGMALRLAFSVATHVDAEVLIIDEALAVGDGHFQKKSTDRIVEFKRRGGTLLFCSHALYFVASICEEALWLDHGRPREQGSVLPVLRKYETYLQNKEPVEATLPAVASDRPAWLTDVLVHDGSGSPRSEFASGETLAIDVAFETVGEAVGLTVRIGVDRDDGVQIFAADTREWRAGAISGRTRYRIRLTLPDFPISHGEFKLFVFLADENALHVYDARIIPAAFGFVSSGYNVGLLAPGRSWADHSASLDVREDSPAIPLPAAR